MAVARPVRALLFLAAALWCLFLYNLFSPMSLERGPGDRYVNFERDPNLDRGFALRLLCHRAVLLTDARFV